MAKLATAILLASLATAPHAQTREELLTLWYLDQFYGMCLNNEYTSAQLIDLANYLDWEALPEDIIRHQRPAASMSYWGAWIANVPGDISVPFFAYAGISAEGTETCGAFFRKADTEIFIETFEKETSAKIAEEERGFFDTTRYYTIPSLPRAGVKLTYANDGEDIYAFAVFAADR